MPEMTSDRRKIRIAKSISAALSWSSSNTTSIWTAASFGAGPTTRTTRGDPGRPRAIRASRILSQVPSASRSKVSSIGGGMSSTTISLAPPRRAKMPRASMDASSCMLSVSLTMNSGVMSIAMIARCADSSFSVSQSALKRATEGTKIRTSATMTKKSVRTSNRAERLCIALAFRSCCRGRSACAGKLKHRNCVARGVSLSGLDLLVDDRQQRQDRQPDQRGDDLGGQDALGGEASPESKMLPSPAPTVA